MNTKTIGMFYAIFLKNCFINGNGGNHKNGKMEGVMRSTRFRQKFIALAMAIFFLSACSTTLIKSDPTGAKVYVKNKYKGETPYYHRDGSPGGTTKKIKLEKEGYQDFHACIKREKADLGAILAGALLFYPLLIWWGQYPGEYDFKMKEVDDKPKHQGQSAGYPQKP